jgi:carboxymethylenebutenolidase
VSTFSERPSGVATRREALRGGVVAALCNLGCGSAAAAQVAQPSHKALEDSDIEQGFLEFQGGRDRIDAYMARPRAAGRYPVVLVIAGAAIAEAYIPNTAAMLAQAGLIGFAPNIYWLQKQDMNAAEKAKVFADEITDRHIFADLFASLAYLDALPFVKPGRAGAIGFCFGGRCALMFATQCEEIAAVAPFYGNLKTPAFAKRDKDPVDVVRDLNVAIQGHYSNSDPEIPRDQLAAFENDLRARKTDARFFTYDAPHGFFAYTRASYRAAAADLAWARTVRFLHDALDARTGS